MQFFVDKCEDSVCKFTCLTENFKYILSHLSYAVFCRSSSIFSEIMSYTYRNIKIVRRSCSLLSKLFQDVSSFNVRRLAYGARTTIQCSYRTILVQRRGCSSQITDENTLKTTQESNSDTSDQKLEDSEIVINETIPELESVSWKTEDESDPCAGLEFDVRNETSLNTNTSPNFVESSKSWKDEDSLDDLRVEDERFPLPSEPLNKGTTSNSSPVCGQVFITHKALGMRLTFLRV